MRKREILVNDLREELEIDSAQDVRCILWPSFGSMGCSAVSHSLTDLISLARSAVLTV